MTTDKTINSENTKRTQEEADTVKAVITGGGRVKAILISVLTTFLFVFMLMIFGPAEVFFANNTEFAFVYGEFGYRLMLIAAIIAIVAGVAIGFLPQLPRRIVNSVFTGISLAAYVQTMFLNKGLDLLGLNPNGYEVTIGRCIWNALVWIAVIAVVIVLALKLKKDAVNGGIAGFLLAVQLVALVSLYLTAGEDAYSYPDSEYHLTGVGQMELAEDNNVVLFILDSFSDLDLDNAMAERPDALEAFHDFTFYTNEDAVLCGTYPSLMHMLTAVDLELDQPVNKWISDAWTGDRAEYFYSALADKGYGSYIYTDNITMLTGTNAPEDLLLGKVSNFGDDSLSRQVDNQRLCVTMTKMSAYRMAPECLKNAFYTGLDEYEDVVTVTEDPVAQENYDFYDRLTSTGLSLESEDKGRLIVQHLMGTHLFKNDEYGEYKEDAGAVETALGCLNIVTEYMEQMKELGVYDSSTIIVTADHGMGYGQQPIFLVKQPDTTATEVTESDAPISHNELLATLAQACGIDPDPIGETIYDYSDGQQRERTLYLRNYFEDYPAVQCYTGDKDGSDNVYVGYTYTGDEEDLEALYWDGYSEIIPMVESFF